MMSNLEDHVVSIFEKAIHKNGIAKGSGFCIAPTFVLTARHVIENIKLKQIHIGLIDRTDSGGRVKKVYYLNDHYDAVIIELHEAHNKPIVECDFNHRVASGQSVKLIVYHVDEANAAVLTKNISNIHRDDEHWHFDNYPAKGMSGGAVVYQGKAIGIIRAQSKENNDGVFIPLHLFEKEIKTILGDDISQDHKAETILEEGGNNDHLQAQRNKLSEYLSNLKEETEEPQEFYNALLIDFLGSPEGSAEDLQEALLKSLDDNAASLVKSLRKCSEPYAEGLQQKIEELLLLLLTQLIDKETWLNNSLHKLNVRTRVLSELQMSARYAIKPSLKKYEGLGVAGKHIITEDLSCKELGIDYKDNAKFFAETIALKLYKKFDDIGDFSISDMDDAEWLGVNETILELREVEANEFHRIEIDTKRTTTHPLLTPEVCAALYKLLPDLPITHFGHSALENETRLRSQVSLFFGMLYPRN